MLPSQQEFKDLLRRMNDVFDRHGDYEYEVIQYDGSCAKVLFGDANYSWIPVPAEFGRFHYQNERENMKLKMVPFYEEFVQAAGIFAKDMNKMMGLCYAIYRWREDGMYGLSYLPWFEAYLNRGLAVNYNVTGYDLYKRRYWQIQDVLRLLPQLFEKHACFALARKCCRSMIAILGEDRIGQNCVQKTEKRVSYYYDYKKYPVNHKMILFWRQMMRGCAAGTEDFAEWFMEEYRFMRSLTEAVVLNGPDIEDYFRAVQMQLIPKDVLIEQLLMGSSRAANIRVLTNPNRWPQGRRIFETYPWARELVRTVVERIVEVESRRGELPTALTEVARAIERFEGAGYFCNLLAALGKENFFRGYEYSSDTTKKAVLSRLLKRCYPAADDTPEKLKVYLKKTDIKEKRLAEAIMYAPQWAGFAEAILEWPGLKCGVWFFHAHINETFSAEKETEVALYSPITPQQFNDGRYEFIQKFLKESKQFGAQRRESEKKACQTALENLAITTGFMDVNRMTWYLESEKMEEIRPLMQPQEIDGVNLWLEIDKEGMAGIAIEKNGRRQKTVPKALSKHEAVLTIKETVKDLKEQRRRAKESLERAMVERTEFHIDELERISSHPVLAPMLLALVWTDGTVNGRLEREDETIVLRGVRGEEISLPADGQLRAAHPYDLMKAGEWAQWMHFFYEHQIVQPFKQVFREYYPITEDERQEKNVSRRYAGHQVQPQKTVALLKSRGWTVDYEEGLQKVCYKENLIVRMYALADWFSPADIEAPTLETIRFFDRKTGDIVNLEDVPPVLFSEAMRDMDLVVSVAHVGGVDPEASHSTVEMRTAIAAELIRLLKLSNVEFIGSHAKIHGKLANYSVHMGSGVVHGEGIRSFCCRKIRKSRIQVY